MSAPVAVIVVAGGRSSRFGSDKLHHRIDGRTLLERTVDAVSGCGPVVMVWAAASATGVDGAVAVAVSEVPRWGGPCAAIAAGVDAVAGVAGVAGLDGADADAADVLILPADLADPASAVAELLAVDGGVLVDGTGRPQWLLARAPLAALRCRIAELLRGRPALDGVPASALLSVVEGRYPVADRVCADIDVPSDVPGAAASPVESEPKEVFHGTI